MSYLKNKFNFTIFFTILFLFFFYVINQNTYSVNNQTCFHNDFNKFYNKEIRNTEVTLDCKNNIEIKGLKILFPGNLHSQSSYKPNKISIQFYNNNEVVSEKILKIYKNYLEVYFNKKIITDKIKIKNEANNTVLINKLLIYEDINKIISKNFINFFSNFLSDNLLGYYLLSIAIFLIIFISGSSIQLILKQDICVIGIFPFGILFLILIAILKIFINNYYFFYIPYFLFLLLIINLIKNFRIVCLYISKNKINFVYIISLIFYFNLFYYTRESLFSLNYNNLFFINSIFNFGNFIGNFGYHADSYFPYVHALNFSNAESNIYSIVREIVGDDLSGKINDRGFVFPFSIIGIQALIEESIFTYYRFLILIATFFLICIYKLTSGIFNNHKLSILFCLSLIIQPSLLSIFINIELYPKYFSLGFGLLFIQSYFQNKLYLNSYLNLFLSIASHPIGILLAFCFLFLMLIKRFINKQSIIKIMIILIIVVSYKLIMTFISLEVMKNNEKDIYISQINNLNYNIILLFKNFISIFIPNFQNITELKNNYFEYFFTKSLFSFLFFSSVLFIYVDKDLIDNHLIKYKKFFLVLSIMPIMILLMTYKEEYYGGLALVMPISTIFFSYFIFIKYSLYELKRKYLIFYVICYIILAYTTFDINSFDSFSGLSFETNFYKKVYDVIFTLFNIFLISSLVRKYFEKKDFNKHR